jgi:hypothetical protein
MQTETIETPVAKLDEPRVTGALAERREAPPSTPQAVSMLNIIERAAFDPSVDIARLEMLFDMQRRMIADEAKVAFERAMSAAQGEMGPVTRDAQNSHTNSRYARLEAVIAAIGPIYTKHGFSLSFNQGESPSGAVKIICKVGHAGGHHEIYDLTGGLDAAGSQGKANKTAIQATGSTITYLRRYLTCMIFNVAIVDEDKDGNAASHNKAHLMRIDEKQKGEILSLLKSLADAKIETATFYTFIREHMDAETVDDLKVSDYPNVITALKNKLRAAQKPPSDDFPRDQP